MCDVMWKDGRIGRPMSVRDRWMMLMLESKLVGIVVVLECAQSGIYVQVIALTCRDPKPGTDRHKPRRSHDETEARERRERNENMTRTTSEQTMRCRHTIVRRPLRRLRLRLRRLFFCEGLRVE